MTLLTTHKKVKKLASVLLGIVLFFQLGLLATASAVSPSVLEEMDKVTRLIASGELRQAEKIVDGVIKDEPEYDLALYQKAVIRIRMNDYKVGVALIERAVALNDQRAEYMQALASMYDFLGQFEKAIAAYKKISLMVPEGSDSFREAKKQERFLKGSMAARLRDYGKAIEMFSGVVEIDPDDVKARYSLGVAYLLSNDIPRAEKALVETIAQDETYVDAYMSLADLYEKTGRLHKSIALMDALLALPKVDARLRNAVEVRMNLVEGMLLVGEGNYAEAEQVFIVLSAINSANPKVIYGLGRSQLGQSKFDLAEQAFERLLVRLPSYYDAAWYLAEAYYGSGKFELSVREFDRLARLGVDNSYGLKAIGKMAELEEDVITRPYVMSLRAEQARTTLEEDDKNVNARIDLADYYYEIGEFDLAINEYYAALEIAPNNYKYRIRLAGLLEGGERLFEAATQYAIAISVVEDERLGHRGAGVLLMVMTRIAFLDDNLDVANEFVRRLLLLEGDNAEAYFLSGLVLAKMQRFDDAIKAFERLLELSPGHVGARLNIAMNYQRINREEDAIAEYRNILAGNPPASIRNMVLPQLESVERSIIGGYGGLRYSLTLDSNVNQSEVSPRADYRGDLAATLGYKYKMANGIRLRAETSPSHSSYHRGQYDYFNNTTMLSASVRPQGKYTLTTGYSRSSVGGLLNAERYSQRNNLFVSFNRSIYLPHFLTPFSGGKKLTSFDAGMTKTDYDSKANSALDAMIDSYNISLRQSIGGASSLSVQYAWTQNENEVDAGSDYAYIGHMFSIGGEKVLRTGLIANANYALTILNYLYPDSFTGYSVYRENMQHSFNAGLNYYLAQRVRLFANATVVANRSNLPVGYILNAQDVIEGLQSSSLGDYNTLSVTSGVAMSF